MILIAMTATMLMSESALSTRGTSSTARFVERQVEGARRDLRESHSLGQGSKAIFEDLFDVAQKCNRSNWDGYDAIPVSQETFQQAYRLLETLPLGMQPPSVGVEPDGNITLEWYRFPKRTLSLSVSPDGNLHYSALMGPNTAYGTEAFFGDFPKRVLDLVNRVLAA
jgi:hypothetical protein